MIQAIKNNKVFVLASSGILLLMIIIATVVIIVSTPQNNKELTPKEASLQTTIQKETKRKDVLLKDILVEDNNWSIVLANLSNQRNNNAMVVMKGDKILLGPGTDFSIDDLYRIKAPNKIISYFYPEKTHWVGFADFDSRFRYPDRIKAVITSFSIANNIDATKIQLLSSVNYKFYTTENDAIGFRTFKFSINDKAYLFEASTSTMNYQTDCVIKSEDGKSVLFQQAVRG